MNVLQPFYACGLGETKNISQTGLAAKTETKNLYVKPSVLDQDFLACVTSVAASSYFMMGGWGDIGKTSGQFPQSLNLPLAHRLEGRGYR